MKRKDLLLPYRCKIAGWVVLGFGLLLSAAWTISNGNWDFSVNSIRQLLGLPVTETEIGWDRFTAAAGLMGTLTSVLILIGAYLAGFSRCKDEDEFTEHLRYRALTVTMVGLMAFYLLAEVFCWGLKYLTITALLVRISPLLYVAYFHLLVWRERRKNEE